MTRRAAAPVVGVVLLVGCSVALAAALALAVPTDLASPTPRVAVSVTVDPASDRITLTHLSGPSLDVRRLSVLVRVDGTPLDRQPPVPFFAAVGFRSGPTGPFNPASDPGWEVGERASFRVASTNDPPLGAGATVTVRLAVDGRVVARAGTG